MDVLFAVVIVPWLAITIPLWIIDEYRSWVMHKRLDAVLRESLRQREVDSRRYHTGGMR